MWQELGNKLIRMMQFSWLLLPVLSQQNVNYTWHMLIDGSFLSQTYRILITSLKLLMLCQSVESSLEIDHFPKGTYIIHVSFTVFFLFIILLFISDRH